MNTNSNTYTLIYASVMVIIVAFVLAFTSASLKERQEENVRLDKMKQILMALNIDTKNADVKALYQEYVISDPILSADGSLKAEQGGFTVSVKEELAKKPEQDPDLPFYVCKVNGEIKYVMPLYGKGLWDDIWGYVALNADKETVYGSYFSHKGETPGLGAEIALPPFQKQFEGKHLMKDGTVALSVAKHGKVTDPEYEVDGISGGTITSNGVDAMIKECLGLYNHFLTDKKEGEIPA